MILGEFCTNNTTGNAVNNALQDDIFRVGPFLETLDRKNADREPHVGPPCVQRKPCGDAQTFTPFRSHPQFIGALCSNEVSLVRMSPD